MAKLWTAVAAAAAVQHTEVISEKVNTRERWAGAEKCLRNNSAGWRAPSTHSTLHARTKYSYACHYAFGGQSIDKKHTHQQIKCTRGPFYAERRVSFCVWRSSRHILPKKRKPRKKRLTEKHTTLQQLLSTGAQRQARPTRTGDSGVRAGLACLCRSRRPGWARGVAARGGVATPNIIRGARVYRSH